MEEVRLTVVSSDVEAEIVCGLLRTSGIECYHRKTDLGSGATGGMLSGFGPTEIVVASADLEQAREVLANRDDGLDWELGNGEDEP
jgi:homoserine kinase